MQQPNQKNNLRYNRQPTNNFQYTMLKQSMFDLFPHNHVVQYFFDLRNASRIQTTLLNGDITLWIWKRANNSQVKIHIAYVRWAVSTKQRVVLRNGRTSKINVTPRTNRLFLLLFDKWIISFYGKIMGKVSWNVMNFFKKFSNFEFNFYFSYFLPCRLAVHYFALLFIWSVSIL